MVLAIEDIPAFEIDGKFLKIKFHIIKHLQI